MDFSKIIAIMQIVNGIAGMLAQIFQSVQANAAQPPSVLPHVQTIHAAVTRLSANADSQEKVG